jgi:uncharacterized membrane protein
VAVSEEYLVASATPSGIKRNWYVCMLINFLNFFLYLHKIALQSIVHLYKKLHNKSHLHSNKDVTQNSMKRIKLLKSIRQKSFISLVPILSYLTIKVSVQNVSSSIFDGRLV